MNANLCSAAIWPEMGESAALTTGSEAESISAHFLHHLVPHPKRGKYGLYHSPTLSFLSLHCCLRAVGTRTRHPGSVSTSASAEGPGRAAPTLPAWLRAAEGSAGQGAPRRWLRGPSAGVLRAAARASPRAAGSLGSRVSAPRPLQGDARRLVPRNLQQKGSRPVLGKLCGPRAAGGVAPTPGALPGAGRRLTFTGDPPGGGERSGPSAQRDLHGWPSRGRRHRLLLGGWEVFLLCGFTGRGFNEPPHICI